MWAEGMDIFPILILIKTINTRRKLGFLVCALFFLFQIGFIFNSEFSKKLTAA